MSEVRKEEQMTMDLLKMESEGRSACNDGIAACLQAPQLQK